MKLSAHALAHNQGRRNGGALRGYCPSCPLKEGETVAQMPLHNSIISNFTIYQDRLERNILQLFAHT